MFLEAPRQLEVRRHGGCHAWIDGPGARLGGFEIGGPEARCFEERGELANASNDRE
jgi:hypothetical protein